jgi:hypothetical protein
MNTDRPRRTRRRSQLLHDSVVINASGLPPASQATSVEEADETKALNDEEDDDTSTDQNR